MQCGLMVIARSVQRGIMSRLHNIAAGFARRVVGSMSYYRAAVAC